MKIVLFGGQGRLGTTFRRTLNQHDFISPTRDQLDLFDQVTITNFLSEHQPDLAINLSAYTNVDQAEGIGRAEAFHLNGYLPGQLASTCAKQKIRFLHLSTDYVFSGEAENGYTEADQPDPINVYGASKLAGEYAVLAADPTACIVRTSRLYGASAESASAKKSFVELILRDAAATETFQVNGGELASPTWTNDLTHHLDQHLFNHPQITGIVHATNTGSATWFTWAQEILHDLQLPNTITPRDAATLNRPARRPNNSTITSTKLPAMRPWTEALSEYLQQDRVQLMKAFEKQPPLS